MEEDRTCCRCVHHLIRFDEHDPRIHFCKCEIPFKNNSQHLVSCGACVREGVEPFKCSDFHRKEE